MHTSPSTTTAMEELGICILIPTYNNAKTLERVLKGTLAYSDAIFVINDGSTDETAQILAAYPTLNCINIAVNTGKGNALRQGFERARQSGYNYAITIDSDGQHFPDDIPTFVEALQASPEVALLIGARQMNQVGIPRKSSFGNKFSNFWFWFETGIKLDDTQSGFRLYPLHHIPQRLYTKKFELEIEVIVRAAWRGVSVKNIPIKILYDPKERVSHFRPFKDFTRISILNTVLVLITLLYIVPRNAVRSFKKKSFRQFLKEDVLGTDDSSLVKASSIALGVFIGIAPLWGLQSFLSIFVATVLRLNKTLSFTFSNISIPPMIPIIIWLSLKVGAIFITQNVNIGSYQDITFTNISNHLLQYLVGSIILATITAFIFGFSAYFLLQINRKK